MRKYIVLLSGLLLCATLDVCAQQPSQVQPMGTAMENYAYPYPVHYLPLHIQGQDLEMAYMDVKPDSWNGKTFLLLHGKNFFAAYWKDVIRALTAQGYRVVAPDQVGFGKSSKPDIHYSFELLASNTRQVLDTLGIRQVFVVGHSMGGMLATRFSLMYPERVQKLIYENPLGLEDYREKGVPYRSIADEYQVQLHQTFERLVNYQKKNYFYRWKDAYNEWIEPVFRWTLSPEYPRIAMVSALTYEMIYTQPVCHEFKDLKMPVLLMLGQNDHTALGKDRVSPEVLKTLGNFPELGKKLSREIPDCKYIPIPECGHIPHLEHFDLFMKAVLDFAAH
ncbi:alpha/beta hydrolase [Compostibacter hankyongensis]|uniref:Alpha/beta hydrolase n=1 Tax=Compostibacter hankyongensis TaxID=1007089 RepID=A0ABP8FI72_9BACT